MVNRKWRSKSKGNSIGFGQQAGVVRFAHPNPYGLRIPAER